jgi:hypothetical protein
MKGVKRRFLAYSFPPRSPSPPYLAVLERPGFVRAAPALPAATRFRLPSATATCCDRPQAKASHLRSNHSASRRNITCTNIPDNGIAGVPGSHHPQYIDVVHREHACVETAGVRTAKAMGLRGLPSKAWQVNKGWVLAANIAADLAAWNRLLGHHDDSELRDANPDTLRYRVWHLPARLARHARQRALAISPDWPWASAFLTCWQRLCALPAPT